MGTTLLYAILAPTGDPVSGTEPRRDHAVSSLPCADHRASRSGGFILCPGCGVRLMTKADALRTAGEAPRRRSLTPPASATAPSPVADACPEPSHTLPPGTPLQEDPAAGRGDRAQRQGRQEAGETSRTVAGRRAPSSGSWRRSRRCATPRTRSSRSFGRAGEPGRRRRAARGRDGDPAFLAPRAQPRCGSRCCIIDDDPATREAAVAEFEGGRSARARGRGRRPPASRPSPRRSPT